MYVLAENTPNNVWSLQYKIKKDCSTFLIIWAFTVFCFTFTVRELNAVIAVIEQASHAGHEYLWMYLVSTVRLITSRDISRNDYFSFLFRESIVLNGDNHANDWCRCSSPYEVLCVLRAMVRNDGTTWRKKTTKASDIYHGHISASHLAGRQMTFQLIFAGSASKLGWAIYFWWLRFCNAGEKLTLDMTWNCIHLQYCQQHYQYYCSSDNVPQARAMASVNNVAALNPAVISAHHIHFHCYYLEV